MFEYTQKPFWGGPWYSYWMLMVVTLVFGFFGMDHFLLRSPLTGFLKLITNILGLGLWWIYDIVQVFGEKENVMKYGLSAPIVGPLGIGAGMFVDNQPDEKPSKSPLRYLLYLFLLFVPFGFDSLVAGDMNGALAKFISCFVFLLWPIAIAWSINNIYKAVVVPQELFTEGVDRFFPFTWFMGKKGPSVLGPKDILARTDGCEPGGANGFFGAILGMLPPIFTSAIGTFFPGIVPAVEGVAAATRAGAATIKAAANTATNVIGAIHDPAVQTASIASNLVQKVPTALEQTGALASQVQTQLLDYTNPETLKKMAIQTGGGDGDGISSAALFVLFGSVLIGGVIMGLKSLKGINSKNKDDGRKRNDTPPRAS
jgi:hypothetical protein